MADILLKSFYHNWRPVTEEQALRYAKHLYNGITTMDGDERIKYINTRIQGYTVTKDLLVTC